jgi:hypothetical protein
MGDLVMIAMLAAGFLLFYGFMNGCGKLMDEDTKEA